MLNEPLPVRELLLRLKVEYALLWILPLLLAGLYEADILPQGSLADRMPASYYLHTAGILLALVCIPVSLRLFQLSLTRYVRQLPVRRALRSYRHWSEARLCLLLVPALANVAVYYCTLETTGLLCAGMVMTASLFCAPGRQRLENELALPSLTDDTPSSLE